MTYTAAQKNRPHHPQRQNLPATFKTKTLTKALLAEDVYVAQLPSHYSPCILLPTQLKAAPTQPFPPRPATTLSPYSPRRTPVPVTLAPWSAVSRTSLPVLPSRGAQLQSLHLHRAITRRPRLVLRASLDRTQLAAGRAKVRTPFVNVLGLGLKCPF